MSLCSRFNHFLSDYRMNQEKSALSPKGTLKTNRVISSECLFIVADGWMQRGWGVRDEGSDRMIPYTWYVPGTGSCIMHYAFMHDAWYAAVWYQVLYRYLLISIPPAEAMREAWSVHLAKVKDKSEKMINTLWRSTISLLTRAATSFSKYKLPFPGDDKINFSA